jgi:hypothetical protein
MSVGELRDQLLGAVMAAGAGDLLISFVPDGHDA